MTTSKITISCSGWHPLSASPQSFYSLMIGEGEAGICCLWNYLSDIVGSWLIMSHTWWWTHIQLSSVGIKDIFTIRVWHQIISHPFIISSGHLLCIVGWRVTGVLDCLVSGDNLLCLIIFSLVELRRLHIPITGKQCSCVKCSLLQQITDDMPEIILIMILFL